ncbi:MAG TPA: hypothetical protein IAA06_01290 [Candidatus Blautia faecavium]|uniref:Anti-sigma factor RsgI-like middle domain-containing protein n=1 Tax=Candidatus Blautia faecavium TaxID=2838487 RepID=A0A9D2RUQ7_9FIRM|nr:hypothetical protein [Candidatus Blautia faecavium]
MNDRLKNAFDSIRAEDELVEHTRAFLRNRMEQPQKKKIFLPSARFIAALSCLLLFLLAGGVFFLTPVSTISVDINPSIELGINYFDRVVDIKAFNKDGENLMKTLQIKYKPYTEALENILENKTIQECLAQNEAMSITVVSDNEEKNDEVMNNVRSCTDGQGNIYCHAGNSETVEHAHEAGLSYGKYNAFLILQDLDPSVTVEDIQGLTMREIWDRINALSSEDGTDENDSSSRQKQNGSARGQNCCGQSGGQNKANANNASQGRGHHGRHHQE